MRNALKLAALGLSMIAGGCVTSRDLVRSAEHYNLAVEQAQTEMLLLNILRAKDHAPLYLTDMSQLNGSVSRKVTGGATAGLSTTWNRGGTGLFHALTRPFGASSGFEMTENPSFQVDVLSAQEFMQGFLKPISQAEFAYYLQAGWPPDLLFHLLVQQVKLTCKDAPGSPAGEVWRNHPSSADEEPLHNFSDLVREVVGTTRLESQIEVLADETPMVIGNTTEPVTLEELVAAGKEGFKVKHEDGSASWQLERPQTRVQLRLKNWQYFETRCIPPHTEDKTHLATSGVMQQSIAGPPRAVAEPTQAVSYVQSVTLEMRSPEGLLYYLGQLARLEENGSSLGPPRSCDGYMARPIFVLRRGSCSQETAACVEYQGETFVVPKRDDRREVEAKCEPKGTFGPAAVNEATGGESLHTLSLLTQLIALQKNAKEFEGTPVVRVIGQ